MEWREEGGEKAPPGKAAPGKLRARILEILRRLGEGQEIDAVTGVEQSLKKGEHPDPGPDIGRNGGPPGKKQDGERRPGSLTGFGRGKIESGRPHQPGFATAVTASRPGRAPWRGARRTPATRFVLGPLKLLTATWYPIVSAAAWRKARVAGRHGRFRTALRKRRNRRSPKTPREAQPTSPKSYARRRKGTWTPRCNPRTRS